MAILAWWRKQSDGFKGIFFMLLWALCFSLATAIIKYLGPCVKTTTILWARCVFGFFLVAPVVLRQGVAPLKTQRKAFHALRILAISIAMGGAMYAYQRLPLATATSIGMSSPLFATLLAIIFLHERATKTRILALILGYMGVLCIAKPHQIIVDSALFVALLANFSAATAMVTAKKLTATESTGTMMFFASVGTVVLSTILALFDWQAPQAEDLLLLGCITFFGVMSQVCSLTALRYADASYVAPVEYTRLCFAIPVGILIFDEYPDVMTLVGSGLIILATYTLTRLEKKRQAS